MNNKLFTALIVLMAIMLAALISIQIYWIRNAMVMRAQQFDQNVSEALNRVAQNIERQDAASFLFGETFGGNVPNQAIDRKIRLMHNRLSHSLENELQPLIKEMEEFKSTVLTENITPGMNLIFDSSIVIIDSSHKGAYTGTISLQVADSTCKIHIATNSREQMIRSVNEHIAKLNHRKNLVSDIFFQFFSNERNIHDRIPRNEMQGLIQEALLNEGIETPFEFVVTTQFGKAIASSGNFDLAQLPSSHRVTLFPNDLFSEHNFLLVQFPSKRDYIMKSLDTMAFSSIGLVLVISLCFAYTIHIIFRQKKLSDMKTDFVNNMTHELKTPISTISLASEMLTDPRVVTDQSRIQKYAGVIHDENKRLGGHVEKVLQMAVLDKGEHQLKKSLINLHTLIQNAISKMTLQLEERNGTLHTRFEATFPEAQADETHFTNIIINLLDNAIKYSQEKPDITVATVNDKGGIIISVTDKGIGMSREAQKRVFEKFYRVPTGNVHNVKGFGLGLSYVKAMVEAHGGSVKLKSELNKGTTFEIFIPHSNPIA